jgi:glycosyltransferase involved in cell wall biosynthesis
MRCLFLAPLKSPDHAVPSGDRTIGRLFIELLSRLGIEVEIASHLRSLSHAPDATEDDALVKAGQAEVARILAAEQERRNKPAFVFCYHLYHKAPDVIGPAVSQALSIPYVVAEASRAPKRAEGPFARRFALAEAAIRAAGLILCPTSRDRVMLEVVRPDHQAIVDLKPFLDLARWPGAQAPIARHPGPVLRLVTVAMMREGYKRASYRVLAEALDLVTDIPFTLDVIGDGKGRAEIEAAFRRLSDRVRFHGRIDDAALISARFAAADLFVWPAVDEPFGMAFLEAQAHGLPCLAGAGGGVRDVIRSGETGLTVEPGDAAAFADGLRQLAADRARLRAMGAAARRFVHGERDLETAARIVAAALARLGIIVPARERS